MRCLNIKLTYDCNNRCLFCFSQRFRETKVNLKEVLCQITEGYDRGCRHLVITGGEPTLKIDHLEAVITKAINAGYDRCTIQTNGMAFAETHGDAIRLMKDYADKIEFAVSVSVHGYSAESHERVTGVTGSFGQTIMALKNLKNIEAILLTNTVVTSINIGSLDLIADLLSNYFPEIMQLAVAHLPTGSSLRPSFTDIVSSLDRLLRRAEFDIVTEGIPYCCMKGFESCVGESLWPRHLDVFDGINKCKTDFNQARTNMRWKNKECIRCLFDEICLGVWAEYKAEFDAAFRGPVC